MEQFMNHESDNITGLGVFIAGQMRVTPLNAGGVSEVPNRLLGPSEYLHC